MNHIRHAHAIIDALADAGYISDDLVTSPDRFEALVTVAAAAIRKSDADEDKRLSDALNRGMREAGIKS